MPNLFEFCHDESWKNGIQPTIEFLDIYNARKDSNPTKIIKRVTKRQIVYITEGYLREKV